MPVNVIPTRGTFIEKYPATIPPIMLVMTSTQSKNGLDPESSKNSSTYNITKRKAIKNPIKHIDNSNRRLP